MTALETLKSILSELYVSEDGDEYKVELKPGLTEQEIVTLTETLPNKCLPDEIRVLLSFAGGFYFFGLEDITFDNIVQSGFETLFPFSVQLAGDGFGNFWIVDINKCCDWGNIFYVCHDPAVIVKHSDNISQFIEHVHEFGKEGSASYLDTVHENVVMSIWDESNDFIERKLAAESPDAVLKNFALSLPDSYVIADLRNKPNGCGFAWGKFGDTLSTAIRHETELLWGVEIPKKKGLLRRLLGNNIS